MWTLVVMGHGRTEYFVKAVEAVDEVIGWDFFDRHIVSMDGTLIRHMWPSSYEWEPLVTEIGVRHGLTANMAQAIGALTPDDKWVFWLEEDFLVTDAPLQAMADTLTANRDVANMVLARQPWNAQEQAAGSVLATIPGLSDEGGWCRHRAGFWLNPMVAHASLLRSLRPGVESSLTAQCNARGLSYGYWGGVADEPRCLHIGAEGGMGSPGWLA